MEKPRRARIADGAHRRGREKCEHALAQQMRAWRSGQDEAGNPAPSMRGYQLEVSPYSTTKTPAMGDMSDDDISRWSAEIARRDMERTINMKNETALREKQRAGEAA